MKSPISVTANRAFFMFGFEYDNAVIVEQRQVLEAALSTNPKTQKALQKLINVVLKDARLEVVSALRASYKNGDPHKTAYSVRRVVYKKLLGANLNILDQRKKRGDKPSDYEPPRKLKTGQRGGNRVPRSMRTHQVMGYRGIDREWIAHIVNIGTVQRTAGTRNGRLHGNRGSISPRNNFGPAATQAMERAAEKLSTLIDTELMKMLNKN